MDSHIASIHMYMISCSCRVVIRHPHPPIVTIIISLFLLLLLSTLPPSLSQPPRRSNYSLCSQPYKCGYQPAVLYYPFWGGDRPPFCGGGDQFNLTCNEAEDSRYDYASIQMGSPKLEMEVVIDGTDAYTMKMVPRDPLDVCSLQQFNFSLSPPLRYNKTVHNFTLFFDCPSGVSLVGGKSFTCPGHESQNDVYFEDAKDEDLKPHQEVLTKCKRIQVPTEAPLNHSKDFVAALNEAFGKGFNASYISQECEKCLGSKGACGSNDRHEFTCYCPDGSNHPLDCTGPVPALGPSPENHVRRNWEAILRIGATAAVFGAVLVSMAFYFYQRRKKTHYAIPRIQSQSMSLDPSSKDSEEGGYYFGVSIFTYSELEEATNYFDSSKELGEGGFGIVYFGILRDGRCVAVKRLYENNYKRVEQFRNEIKILTRIRHRNLVSLYGCTSRHSRGLLLVYEYISNGTAADHLHGERAKAGTLPWHIRMNIAVETASALAYLHACGIIHRDVKTRNILLDSYFAVKVADFGLSRVILSHVTDISTAPQGTPGYVDPEYYERYRLTDKSDVYSFGVVLIELISSLPAVDITRHSNEINLSSMAINKIHSQALHELVDLNLGFESDYKVRKMINEVAELAYQCLQSSSDKRPSMRQVMDTLKDIQSDDKCKSQPEVMDIST